MRIQIKVIIGFFLALVIVGSCTSNNGKNKAENPCVKVRQEFHEKLSPITDQQIKSNSGEWRLLLYLVVQNPTCFDPTDVALAQDSIDALSRR